MFAFVIVGYFLLITDNVLREHIRTKNDARHVIPSIHDSGSSVLFVAYLFFVVLVPLVKLTGAGSFSIWPVQTTATILMIIGIGIHVWAMQYLGRSYTGKLTTHKGQILVKQGPYKLIRHPGYLGVLLVATGFGVVIGNWIALILILAAFLAVHLYRINVEERMLRAHFGQQYAEYMRVTKRVLPFIY